MVVKIDYSSSKLFMNFLNVRFSNKMIATATTSAMAAAPYVLNHEGTDQ